MIDDIPELRELRWKPRWSGVVGQLAPEALGPQRRRAGHQGAFELIDGGPELRPQRGAPHSLHVSPPGMAPAPAHRPNPLWPMHRGPITAVPKRGRPSWETLSS